MAQRKTSLTDTVKNILSGAVQQVPKTLNDIGNFVNPIHSPVPARPQMYSGSVSDYANRAQQAFLTPLAAGQNLIEGFAKNTPHISLAKPSVDFLTNKNTPQLTKTLVSLPFSVAESFANAPLDYAGGTAKLGVLGGRNLRGEKIDPRQVIAGAGQLGSGIVGLSTIPGLSGAAKSIGTGTFMGAVKSGVFSGAKYGAATGFTSGIQKNTKAKDVRSQLLQSVPEAAIGAAGGAVLGGTLAGGGYAINKGLKFMERSAQDNSEVLPLITKDTTVANPRQINPPDTMPKLSKKALLKTDEHTDGILNVFDRYSRNADSSTNAKPDMNIEDDARFIWKDIFGKNAKQPKNIDEVMTDLYGATVQSRRSNGEAGFIDFKKILYDVEHGSQPLKTVKREPSMDETVAEIVRRHNGVDNFDLQQRMANAPRAKNNLNEELFAEKGATYIDPKRLQDAQMLTQNQGGIPIGMSTKATQSTSGEAAIKQAFKEGKINQDEAMALIQDLQKLQSAPTLSKTTGGLPESLKGSQQGSQSTDLGAQQDLSLTDSISQPNGNSNFTKIKQRGLTSSVQENAILSDATKQGTSGVYIPKKNQELMGEARALLEDNANLRIKNVKGIDKKIAATIQEAINLDKAGNHQAAANLFNNLSEQGTELGRGVQAFSMLDKMSPEAISLSAASKIRQYNATASRPIPELSGEQQKLISDQVSLIDGLDGRDKNIAIGQLQQMLNDFIPSSIADKAITVWKAGLLTSLRTHERNLVGNTIMGGSEFAKDIPATAADKLLSLRTGQRTLTLTGRGTISGAKKGFEASKDIVKMGFDPEDAIGKYDVRHVTWGNNPVEQGLKKYTDVVFRTLGAEDKPFWNASYARSLYDQAGAQAINAGKSGDAKFIQDLVDDPTEAMLTNAVKDANYATFHDKTILASLASSAKKAMSKKEWGAIGSLGKAITEGVAPFTGVPSSIVGKTISYSPIGLIKGIAEAGNVAVNNIPELQRQASQDIGRGVIGSAIFALGAYLMKQGLMTGQPKDAKEAQLWQAQGKQANSVLVNGKWRSINSIGPQNLIALAGAKYQEAIDNGGDMGAYGAGLLKDQLNQTFLQGVQGPLNAITNPNRYGNSFVGSTAGSFVPNILKDVSKAVDPYARELNTPVDYVKSGIPGVRNTLLPKRDVLGNIIPQEPTGISAFIDLFNSKSPISNAVVDELARLNSVGNEATPSKLTRNQTILKQKVKLTFEQLNNLEAGVGEALKPQLESLISNPAYQQLDDEHKAKAIDNLVSDVRSQYKNLNADSILSGKSATGFPQVNTTIQKSSSTPAGKSYSYVDNLGNYKTITLKNVAPPELTGNALLDKKLISTYRSSLNSDASNIVKLYQQGQLTATEADKALQEITNKLSTAGTGKAKKPKKLSIGKIKPVNVKRIAIKLGKVKFPKQKKLKLKGLLTNSKRKDIKIKV